MRPSAACNVRVLELDVNPKDQHDRARWPELRRLLTEVFARRTRDEWTAVFDGTDACVAPVLSLNEAAQHPHITARRTLTMHDGVLQAAPAPRFSSTPTALGTPPPAPGQDTEEVLRSWGVEPAPIA